MLQARLGPDGQTPVGGPGNSLMEFLTAGTGNQLMASSIQRFFDIRSRTFEVDVEVNVGGYTRHYVAIVARNSAQDLPVLSFHVR
jgi:hypothetical protein